VEWRWKREWGRWRCRYAAACRNPIRVTHPLSASRPLKVNLKGVTPSLFPLPLFPLPSTRCFADMLHTRISLMNSVRQFSALDICLFAFRCFSVFVSFFVLFLATSLIFCICSPCSLPLSLSLWQLSHRHFNGIPYHMYTYVCILYLSATFSYIAI